VILASEGDAAAQNQLGALLATGDGAPRDLRASLYWYFEAIRQGYVQAKWNAGSMLVNREVDLDDGPALGMALIEEAAAANDSSACLFLAHCYHYGTHGKKANRELARYWEVRSADYKNLKVFDVPSKTIEGIALPPPSLNLE